MKELLKRIAKRTLEQIGPVIVNIVLDEIEKRKDKSSEEKEKSGKDT